VSCHNFVEPRPGIEGIDYVNSKFGEDAATNLDARIQAFRRHFLISGWEKLSNDRNSQLFGLLSVLADKTGVLRAPPFASRLNEERGVLADKTGVLRAPPFRFPSEWRAKRAPCRRPWPPPAPLSAEGGNGFRGNATGNKLLPFPENVNRAKTNPGISPIDTVYQSFNYPPCGDLAPENSTSVNESSPGV
jgi:hypothetical protein